MKPTRRCGVYVGFKCNTRCKFCYYGVSILEKGINRTTAEVKKILDYMKKHGIETIDFTGGEPTIRKDIFELVAYAKKLGFREIGIITNGVMLSSKKFTEKLIDSGINDVLFSINGHNAKLHDYLTQTPHSFERLMQGVEHVKNLNVHMRTNTVVLKSNYKQLEEIGSILLDFKPHISNFILFNPYEEAVAFTNEIVPFSEASPYLVKIIELLKPKIKIINIRYIPFCFLEGYEKHVYTPYQIQYDPYEWNSFIKEKVYTGKKLAYYHTLKGILQLPKRKLLSRGLSSILVDAMIKTTEKHRSKGKVCKECRYNSICGGLSKEYVRAVGFNELNPVEGKPVYDPAHFLGWWKTGSQY